MRFRRSALLASLWTLLSATPAAAHLVSTGLGPVYDGMGHLLLSPEDLLPAIALGLYAGLRGAHFGRVLIGSLPVSWFLGGILGLVAPGLGLPPLTGAFSFLVTGALLASDLKIPRGTFTAIVVLFGGLHGAANGTVMTLSPTTSLRILAGVGFLLFVLLSLSSAFVLSLKARWMHIAIRVLGSWTLATGILLVGWSLRTGG